MSKREIFALGMASHLLLNPRNSNSSESSKYVISLGGEDKDKVEFVIDIHSQDEYNDLVPIFSNKSLIISYTILYNMLATMFRLVIRLQTDLRITTTTNALQSCIASIEGNGHTVYLDNTFFIGEFYGSYIRNINFKFIKNTEYVPIRSATSTVLSKYKKDNYDITFENISVDYGTTNTITPDPYYGLIGLFIFIVMHDYGSSDTKDAVKNSTLIIKNVKIINTPTIILKKGNPEAQSELGQYVASYAEEIYVGSIVGGYYAGWNKARVSGCTDTVKVQYNNTEFDVTRGGVIGTEYIFSDDDELN